MIVGMMNGKKLAVSKGIFTLSVLLFGVVIVIYFTFYMKTLRNDFHKTKNLAPFSFVLKNYKGNFCKRANVLLQPVDVCKTASTSSSDGEQFSTDQILHKKIVDILVVVFSATDNLESRNTIRTTWGNVSGIEEYYNKTYRISVIFALGWPCSSDSSVQDEIIAESNQYKDLLQNSFYDSYPNLTIKGLATFDWILTNCKTDLFVLKTDDDVLVNVYNLISYLNRQKLSSNKDLLMGNLAKQLSPNRNEKSTRFCPYEVYRRRTFPNFLSGTGYLMSRSALQKIFNAAMTRNLFHLEDVFFTGMCADKAKVQPRNCSLFDPSLTAQNSCSYVKHILSHHKANIKKYYLTPNETIWLFHKCRKPD